MPVRSPEASSRRLERGNVARWRDDLRQAHGANLELGDLRNRIDRADRAVVGRTIERPVIGDEHGIGPNRLPDLRPNDDCAAAAFDADGVAVRDAQRVGQAGMDLAVRLRILVNETAYPPGLRPRQVM